MEKKLVIGRKTLSRIFFMTFFLLFSFKQENGQKNKIAITIDDLPDMHGRAGYVIPRLIRTLSINDIPAYGFVNEGKLYVNDKIDSSQVQLLENWLDNKLYLGNHSYSHILIDQVPLSEYKADVLKGEEITKQLLTKRNQQIKYYRHTQLRTGPTVEVKKELDSFLKANGYVTAPVTIDNNEYIFANIYARAKQKGDKQTMDFVSKEYLVYMEKVFDHFESLSISFLGYNLSQILLLHANELNADYLDELIIMMKRKRYSFISLDEALEDPAYKLEEAHSKKGLSWIHRWMLAKGREIKLEPEESDTIKKMDTSYK